jgi:hypothetical protein
MKQITIHQAKGLEFPTVFIPRFNEGTIPLDSRMSEGSGSESGQSRDYSGHIQEERRLAFVAISRAKSKLFVSWVGKSRFGEALLPSRFIDEIPSHLTTLAAAAPSDAPIAAFPQCHGPQPRIIHGPPHSSSVGSSTPHQIASTVTAPNQQGFMGAFRKASDLLAEQAAGYCVQRKPNK